MIPAIPIITIAISWIVAAINTRSCVLPTDLDALSILLSKLSSSLPGLEFKFDISTAFVVVGVAIEVVMVILVFWKDRREYTTDLALWEKGGSNSPHKPLISIAIIEVIAAVFVAGGVAGEFWYGTRISIVNSCIQQADNARTVILVNRAAALEKEAASLRKEAESERLARVRLEAEVQPRFLTEKQSAAITEACRKKLQGWDIAVASYTSDVEPTFIAAQYIVALNRAGAYAKDNVRSVSPGPNPIVFGVGVYSKYPGMVKEIVDAFSEALGKGNDLIPIPLATDPRLGTTNSFRNLPTIWGGQPLIFFGPKPLNIIEKKKIAKIMQPEKH